MEYIDSQKDTMVTLWDNIVRLESWSSDIAGVRRLAEHLDTYYLALGLHTAKMAKKIVLTILKLDDRF